MAGKSEDQDPDESVEFDPLTNPPPPPMDHREASRLRRQAYMRDYSKKRAAQQKIDRGGRPVGRPPRPKGVDPVPKNYQPVWAPLYKEDGTPGPQFALLSCPFPEIFFGGARGGGKTDGAIGKWLQHASRYGENAKGVFFRRRFKQLEDVQARCTQIFSRINATYNKGDATWVFPNGAVLKLRHLWDIAATEEYHGHSYCVAAGTPILMADGSYQAIETIQVGDLVMTLEGPKPVTATVSPGMKPCVRAEVFDSSGVKLGEQIHPEDHPVLTSVLPLPGERSSTFPASPSPWHSRAPGSEPGLRPSGTEGLSCPDIPVLPGGPISQAHCTETFDWSQTYLPPQKRHEVWQSYTTLLDAHRESLASSACPGDDQSGCISSADGCPGALPLPTLSCPVVLHGPDLQSGQPYMPASTQCHGFGISSEFSDRKVEQTRGRILNPQQPLGLFESSHRRSTHHPEGDGSACDLLEMRIGQDSQGGCSMGPRPHGGQLLRQEEIFRSSFPLQVDAVLRSHQPFCVDEEDCIPGYIQHQQESYVHPYTGEHRNIVQPHCYGVAVFEPCEPHFVYDLTIADANHYVTKNRTVNRNSFLCFEEVTNWSTPDAINRLRGTLRSSAGVTPELIMTGNPGGSGHCVPYGLVRTPTGWTDIKDLKVGDAVMTVTPYGEIKASRVSQTHKRHYSGPMMTLAQDDMSMVFTPNHKIAVVGPDGKMSLVAFNEMPDDFTIPRSLFFDGTRLKMDHYLRDDLELTTAAVETYDYEGDVYCIGVPETHSFILQQDGSVWVSGNSWVKARYISPAPQGWTPIKDEETGEFRIYIPSRLTDNSAMMKNDPTYANRLRGTGSATLVNAWLNGDWDIVAGGFFDDLIIPSRHFLQPFSIPAGWSWRRSFDWGSAAPAWLGIWAVSDGNPVSQLDGFVFPRGSLILVKEWYTCAKTKSGDIIPNDGLRLTNLALGKGIAERSLGHRFSGCVADPSIYSKLGRESIYDEMRKGAKEAGHNLIMAPADNNRVAGWQKMRDMLESSSQERPERPGLWVFESCVHWLRTVPVMQRSDNDFDELDTTQEDHCADGTRYACMTGSRTLKIGDLVGR